MSRSEEEAIDYVLEVKVEQVCLILFAGELEKESITLKGNLAFKDFGVEEGELIHTCTIAFTQWRVPRGGGVEGRHAHRAFELAVIIIHRPLNIEVKALK